MGTDEAVISCIGASTRLERIPAPGEGKAWSSRSQSSVGWQTEENSVQMDHLKWWNAPLAGSFKMVERTLSWIIYHGCQHI